MKGLKKISRHNVNQVLSLAALGNMVYVPARFHDLSEDDDDGVICEIRSLKETLGVTADTVFWVVIFAVCGCIPIVLFIINAV